MSILPAPRQHEAEGSEGGGTSRPSHRRQFSLPWPICGGAEDPDPSSNFSPTESSLYDKGDNDSVASGALSQASTRSSPQSRRTLPVVPLSCSSFCSTQPTHHPGMVVRMMEPQPDPPRIRGGGCCGGGGGNVTVAAPQSKAPGIQIDTTKPATIPRPLIPDPPPTGEKPRSRTQSQAAPRSRAESRASQKPDPAAGGSRSRRGSEATVRDGVPGGRSRTGSEAAPPRSRTQSRAEQPRSRTQSRAEPPRSRKPSAVPPVPAIPR